MTWKEPQSVHNLEYALSFTNNEEFQLLWGAIRKYLDHVYQEKEYSFNLARTSRISSYNEDYSTYNESNMPYDYYSTSPDSTFTLNDNENDAYYNDINNITLPFPSFNLSTSDTSSPNPVEDSSSSSSTSSPSSSVINKETTLTSDDLYYIFSFLQCMTTKQCEHVLNFLSLNNYEYFYNFFNYFVKLEKENEENQKEIIIKEEENQKDDEEYKKLKEISSNYTKFFNTLCDIFRIFLSLNDQNIIEVLLTVSSHLFLHLFFFISIYYLIIFSFFFFHRMMKHLYFSVESSNMIVV